MQCTPSCTHANKHMHLILNAILNSCNTSCILKLPVSHDYTANCSCFINGWMHFVWRTGGKDLFGIPSKWGDLIARVFTSSTWEHAFQATRCISTAAADTPAHGETGVPKPLANTEEHTHAGSRYTSYHHPCYSMWIVIIVSQVAIIVNAVILNVILSCFLGSCLHGQSISSHLSEMPVRTWLSPS